MAKIASNDAIAACTRKEAIEGAMRALQSARNLLSMADAPKTLERVRLAISSCKGAMRNADNRVFRETRK